MNVFDYLDYVEFIQVHAGQNPDRRGYQSRMAREAGCQRSYLSSILHGNAHFSLEQGLRLKDFFAFDEIEVEYFLELVGLARAGTEELRQHILLRVMAHKKRALSAASRLDRPMLNSHDVAKASLT